MIDEAQKQRLAQLEAKINAAKKAQEPEPPKETHFTLANMAWRMVTELVAGLVIGLGIGFGLDSLFGTMPLFLVLFLLLGLVAGVNVMLRSAKEIQAKQIEAEAAATKAVAEADAQAAENAPRR